MRHTKELPSLEFLHETFSYNPTTGELRRKPRDAKYFKTTGLQEKWNRENAGKVITSRSPNGYIEFQIMGRTLKAHRVIAAMVLNRQLGSNEVVDHINGIKTDNRWCNLRVGTQALNTQNLRRARKDSFTGVLGVSPSPYYHWIAQIQRDGVKIQLGTYRDVTEAAVARRYAENALFDAKPNHALSFEEVCGIPWEVKLKLLRFLGVEELFSTTSANESRLLPEAQAA